MGEQVLDFGYVNLVEFWGSDEKIVEAARMSTAKGFMGWGDEYHYERCPDNNSKRLTKPCDVCNRKPGDSKFLRFLYEHQHTTPFEMAGATFEIQAPIFVFREWHRHRTMSYNEMSARYIPLPDVNYMPSRERVIEGAKASGNKQAEGVQPLLHEAISDWQHAVAAAYEALERTYQTGLELGIPKELARIVLPVGRYSRMRVSANLLNWIRFLRLRMAPNAQWEIRQYANVVSQTLETTFPRTMHLFLEEQENAGRK